MTSTRLFRISNLMIKRTSVPFIKLHQNGCCGQLNMWSSFAASSHFVCRNHQLHNKALVRRFSSISVHDKKGKVSDENADVLAQEDLVTAGGKYAQIKANLPEDLTAYPQEDLYGAIKRMSIDEILNLVSRSYKTLDRMGLAICMKNLHRRVFRLEDEEEKAKICAHLKYDLAFQMLVACLVKKSKYYNSTIVFDMVEFLHTFNFTSTEFPMKVYLHLSRFHISDMYLDQIVKLANIANKLPKTKETELLLQGMEVILSSKQDKIGSLMTWEKIHLLDIFGHSLDEAFTQVILRELWLDREDIWLKFGMLLVRALNQCKYLLPEKIKLFQHCINIIEERFDRISVENLPELLDNLKDLSEYNKILYREFLINSAEKLCVSNVLVTIPQKISVLQMLWDAHLFHEKLMLDISDNLKEGFESVSGSSNSLKSLLCVGLYVSEAPKEYSFVESFEVEKFTETAFSQIEALNLTKTEDSPGIFGNFEDISRLNTVICNLWRRNGCSMSEWTRKAIDESNSDIEPLKRSDLPGKSCVFEADVLSVLKIVADQLNLSLHEASGKSSTSGLKADWELRCVSTEDVIPVLFVTSTGYFHNTLQLKRSTEECVENMQKDGAKVLLISPDLLSNFEDQELEKWLTNRITNIDRFQSLDTWSLNV